MPKDTTKGTTAKATATNAATRTPRARRTGAAVKPTRRRAAAAPAPVTHERIALRAYEIHLEGTDGDAVAHWLRAERELVGV